MFQSIKKNNKGIALMMALMILSVAMLTGLFMNSIIVGEVRVSLNTVNVVNSYYAAESGVERALYFLTTDQLADNLDYYEDLSVAGNEYNTFGNGARYTYATTSLRAANFSASNITNTNPAHVSIIDPRGNIPTPISWPWGSGSSIYAYVNWKVSSCFPEHASDRLEITTYSFERLKIAEPNVYSPSVDTSVDKTVSVCDCESTTSINNCRTISLGIVSPNKYYRYIFRPLDGEVTNLQFSLNNGEPIYSEALVQVDGKYSSSEYRLQAKMSAIQPSSDIFSYVIFSEEEIIKGQP